MAKIIAIVNQKGGVGKTTTCVNLAAAVKAAGKRVLLCDFDPQANATSGMGVDKTTSNGVYDALINGAETAQLIVTTPYGDVLPSSKALAGAGVEMINMEDRQFLLKAALRQVADNYDFIFIDCPPSLELLTLNALCAADSLLVPVQGEYYALEGLSEYKEVNLFLRGIVPLIGFKSDYVYYDRAERFAGESKYPLKKMISFALDGITSFSVKPLKLISNLGILISVLSIFGLLYALISHLCGVTVAGWTAIVASIWLLGGLQMLCLGVVGGYIGKIYSEVKQRPRFLIETHLKAEPEEKVLDEH